MNTSEQKSFAIWRPLEMLLEAGIRGEAEGFGGLDRI
jgi:hypothetical protein